MDLEAFLWFQRDFEPYIVIYKSLCRHNINILTFRLNR